MARRSSLRASDADRERVAERLRQAAMEGRLLAHELEERLARAFRALTYGELDALVADLPGHGGFGPAPATRGRGRRRASARGTLLEPRRSLALELARRHPLAVAIVGLLVGLSVAAVALTALAVVTSGIWILPLVLYLLFRHRFGGHPRRGGFGSLRGF